MVDSNNNIEEEDRLPGWIVDEYNRNPCPAPDIAERFAYLKNDFKKYLVSSAYSPTKVIEICYDITGKVLNKIYSINEVLFLSRLTEPLISREVGPCLEKDDSGLQSVIVSMLQKNLEGAFVQISFIIRENERGIEIELLDNQHKKVRPFRISINDVWGDTIVETQVVEHGNNAPRFPGPSTGVYVFEIEWLDKKGTLTIELLH